jgi:hypothetical protein
MTIIILVLMFIIWFPAYILFEMLVSRCTGAFVLLLRNRQGSEKTHTL